MRISVTRSLGRKLLLLCGMALLLSIPAFFVDNLVDERGRRADEAAKEIGSMVGGPQTFLGPTLAVPYTVPASVGNATPRSGVYLVFPEQALAKVGMNTEQRHRSLFKVAVFHAALHMEGDFDLRDVPRAAPLGALLDWDRAELLLGVSDAHGAQSDGTVAVNETAATVLTPALLSPDLSLGEENPRVHLTLLGRSAREFASPGARFHVTAELRFSGAQRFTMLAYGKSTTWQAQGDWPAPSFDGALLSAQRNVTKQGFNAAWTVPFLARGVAAEGDATVIRGLESSAMGITLVQVASPYQSVTRAIKYLPLFVGLVFLAYFAFEIASGRRVHPAQYVLVAVAQILFYLLLLSLAEHVGFDVAYVLAGASTVALLSANAGWVFASRKQGLRALAVFGPLYALIYLLLRMDDQALLVGSIAAFAAIAAIMYATRAVDWYGDAASNEPPPAEKYVSLWE